MRKSLLKQMTWEDVKEILDAGELLWNNQKEPTAENILRLLRDENDVPPPIEERFPFILSCAEIASGQKLEDTRNNENTLIRCLVSYRLHNEGYSYSEIGKMVRRDHSTITHLSYRMRDMLSIPHAYKSEVVIYEVFERLVGTE